jgi:hypothetical protein
MAHYDCGKCGEHYTKCGCDTSWIHKAQPVIEPAVLRIPAPTQPVETEEHTGGSSSYYTVSVLNPTDKERQPYVAECNDVIEALGMTFAEGNAFKAIWRTAAARMGKKKKGNNAVYDAEKVIFFGERMLAQAKQQEA